MRFGNLRVGSLGLLVGVLAIFVVGSGVRYGGARRTPSLVTSCTAPGLALSASTVRRGSPLYYAVTGPDQTVIVGIDVGTLGPGYRASAGPDAQVVRIPLPLVGCRGSAVLGVQVGPGRHLVSVYPAAGGAPLTSQPLTVTAR